MHHLSQGGVRMAGHIYITGDCHGNYRRFNTENFPVQHEMDKDDYVIICGDAACLWEDSRDNRYWLKWLSEKPFTTLYVDGNHENFDMLNAVAIQQWNGGKVHAVAPSVMHLMRGQIYDIAGKKFFTFGGAKSHDIQDGILEMDDPNFKLKQKRLIRAGAHYRINHISWWKEELPCDAE